MHLMNKIVSNTAAPCPGCKGASKKQTCDAMQRWRSVAASIIMRAMDQFSLASDFPPASEADWRALVAKALGGSPFETLQTPLYEGFRAEPLYREVGQTPAISGNRGWSIIQPLVGEKQFADDLTGGASAFSVAFDACPSIETIKDDLEPLVGAAKESFFIAPGSSVADAALLFASKSVDGLRGFGRLRSSHRFCAFRRTARRQVCTVC